MRSQPATLVDPVGLGQAATPDLALAVLRSASAVVRPAAAWTRGYASRACPSTLPLHRLISAFLLRPTGLATGGAQRRCQCWRLDISAVAAELISPGQAMTYVHSSFCCSLVDLDLHLVQLAIALLPDRAQTCAACSACCTWMSCVSLRAAAGDNAFIG
uniref:Uncharacterized protein n=1 Tax=Macrostomum lignano TaxID=282301 RepID=A0A1I8FR40_9PLAT